MDTATISGLQAIQEAILNRIKFRRQNAPGFLQAANNALLHLNIGKPSDNIVHDNAPLSESAAGIRVGRSPENESWSISRADLDRITDNYMGKMRTFHGTRGVNHNRDELMAPNPDAVLLFGLLEYATNNLKAKERAEVESRIDRHIISTTRAYASEINFDSPHKVASQEV